MSNIKKLFQQSSHYLTGHVATLAASLVSFPLFTRLLSVSDYGTLDLVTSTLALTIAFSKLGLQNSIIRFYPECCIDNQNNSRARFYSTSFISVVLISLFACVLFVLFVKTFLSYFLGAQVVEYLLFAAILICFGATSETCSQFLRAEQRTKLYNALAIAGRYGRLVLGVFFLLFIVRGIYGLLFGRILAIGGLCVVYIFVLFRTQKIEFKDFSFDLLKHFLLYGSPLVFTEIAHTILTFGDRYLIQYYLGSHSLGIYSAGYNFAMAMALILTVPVRDAIIPMYLDTWTRKGEQETKRFLGEGLRYYSLVAIPAIFGFVHVSKELLRLFASSRYIDSHIVVPYVIIGYTIYGTYSFFASSLIIHKKTMLLTSMLAFSCTLNILLNFALIPSYGVTGAALATLIAYTSYIALIILWGAIKRLMFPIDYHAIILYSLLSCTMVLIIRGINIENLTAELVCKIIAGIAVYALLVLTFDAELRRKMVQIFRQFFQRYLNQRI